MDRLDYLLRDARAAGVPYGEIDLNYLLNNIRVSPKGMLGVEEKDAGSCGAFPPSPVSSCTVSSITTRPSTDSKKRVAKYSMAACATQAGIRTTCCSRRRRDPEDCPRESRSSGFTDDYIDRIVFKAVDDKDPVIQILAKSIVECRPPRLLCSVRRRFEQKSSDHSAASVFRQKCRDKLESAVKRAVIEGRPVSPMRAEADQVR